ncbi:MAG TPA: molecular chaperone TorD family protein [bacterium]|nr:molecular chaperone TorD family protein [bacterium]
MELFRALAALAEPPGPEQIRIGEILGLPGPPDAVRYTEVFVLQLYPYASAYVGAEGMLGGEAQDRVAGFWRALNRVPPAEPDHLTPLLALYASLADCAETEPDPARRLLWGQSRKALLWEHLACWLFPYLDKMRDIAPPCYRAWADLLAEALAAEAGTLGPADALPLHLREAPPLPDPRTGPPEQFLAGLLSPVRSGMLLVRADLARAAREVRLGLRMGERRFILRSLLAQDPERTLGWLAGEARAWQARHLANEPRTGAVARFWAGRAGAAASLVEALRLDELAGAIDARRCGIREADGDPARPGPS